MNYEVNSGNEQMLLHWCSILKHRCRQMTNYLVSQGESRPSTFLFQKASTRTGVRFHGHGWYKFSIRISK